MNKINTIILSGGGIKGGSYIGVFKILFKYIDKLQITHYIGTSIGAIFAVLLTIGYSIEELEAIFINYNFNKFIPPLCIDNLLFNYGITDGNDICTFFKELFDIKNTPITTTFKEIYNKTNIKLTITTTNLTLQQVEYWNHEDYPNYTIYDAIIATSRIPIFFIPYSYNNSLYIDGAIVNNFPFNIIPLDSIENCIGIYLTNKKQHNNITLQNQCNHIIKYITHILTIAYENTTKLMNNNYTSHIIYIEHNSIDSVDFDLTKDKRIDMIEQAKITTELWCKSFFH